MKVLFIGFNYYGYTKAITEEMTRLGADVTDVDIRPRRFWHKVVGTISPSRYAAFLKRHHAQAVAEARKQKYDRVVFLQAHHVEPQLLAELRESQPGVPFVLYNWDSLTTHDFRPQAQYFDRIYTFDRTDAETEGYDYLPLFCSREMQELTRNRARPRQVYCVGTVVNLQRYHAVLAFDTYCRANGIGFDYFLKIRPMVYLRLLAEVGIPRGVSFRSIDPGHFHDMIEQSAAVFDFANHQQSGHTMRTIENLCCGKKIITNNAGVRDEGFFGSDRFLIFDDLDFSGVAEFLDTPLVDKDAQFEDYGVQAFTRRILLLDEPREAK
ncbi:hypothetical protein [Actibacterium sp. D379-3]